MSEFKLQEGREYTTRNGRRTTKMIAHNSGVYDFRADVSGVQWFFRKDGQVYTDVRSPIDAVAEWSADVPVAPAVEVTAKEAYLAFHAAACAKMIEITRRKNADYTGDAADPFSNFRAVEDLGICTTEQGFLTRMTDKVKRIISYCQKGELLVRDESVEDTLLDLANYCLLLAGYLAAKKKGGAK